MKTLKKSSNWKIEFIPAASREIKKLPKNARERIITTIEKILSINPYAGELLKGDFKGYRKFRVGNYRVIYTLEKDRLVVLVIRVAHRKNVYRLPTKISFPP